MSTKNLARTVIEGGRSFFNSWQRRHSHAAARSAEHVVASRARAGDDPDALVWPEPKPVLKEFRDKLSPTEHWLRAQVGRPWWKVRSEIAARFDTRTLAGQHIVFDHLLPSRWERDGTWRVDRDVRFFVDRHGILRARVPARPSRITRGQLYRNELECRRARAFAGGRRIVRRGAHLYWLVPVAPYEPGGPCRHRQDRRLDPHEREVFESFGEPARACITLELRERHEGP